MKFFKVTTNGTSEVKRAAFDELVNSFRQDARSIQINREQQTAEIKSEVRGGFGWETVTTTIQSL